jgi:fibronectin-binding autotransporter adhesin
MPLLKRLASGTSAAVLTLSSLMTLGFTGVVSAASQTCTWTGATDLKFSTATNWSSCAGGVPLAGDVIAFGVIGSGYPTYTLTNDLGVALGGVTYGDSSQGTANHSDYILDTLSFTDGAIVTGIDALASNYPNADVRVTGALTAAGSLTLNGSIDAPISGTPPTVNLTNLNVGSGIVNYAGGPSFVQYNPTGTVIVADGAQYVGTGGESTIFVQNGGTFYPNITGATGSAVTYSVPITYGGGSGSTNPVLSEYRGNTIVSGPQMLNHNVDVNMTDTVTISGPLSGAFTVTKASGATGTLVISSSNNTSNTPNGSVVTPDTSATISDSQPTTDINVADHSTTILDGARGRVEVLNGGILKGNGTAANLYVDKGGTVAPGHSPGKLTVVNTLALNDGSIYQAELKDKAAGDFDQIVVGAATDTTGNDVVLGSTTGPTLDVSLYSGYSIKAGDQFMIINNLSKTAVLGTFAGLPEGATFKVGTGVFKISYVGGDGNDVVLTAVTAPTAPNSGFAFVSAHPGATLGITVAAAGFIFALAKSNSRKLTPTRAKSTRRRR